MSGTVITCETLGRGKISGKVAPKFYYPAFARILKEHGIAHQETYSFDQLRLSKAKHAVVVLIYSETYLHTNAEYKNRVQEQERYAIDRFGERNVIHPTRVGLTIGDKAAANHWLAAANIPMPRLANKNTVKIFSNQRVGSHAPAHLVEAGSTLNTKRYNTQFVDTAHDYKGSLYYVSLRAMCVGRRCVAVYARMRPVSEGPSVHDTDTPRRAELINHFHEELVAKRMSALTDLADRLGRVLGLGFYAHDILPEEKTGNLYLCETGYKIDEFNLRKHLEPLREQLVFRESLFEPFAEVSAKVFLEELARLNLLQV